MFSDVFFTKIADSAIMSRSSNERLRDPCRSPQALILSRRDQLFFSRSIRQCYAVIDGLEPFSKHNFPRERPHTQHRTARVGLNGIALTGLCRIPAGKIRNTCVDPISILDFRINTNTMRSEQTTKFAKPIRNFHDTLQLENRRGDHVVSGE
jgi:hypothetical protein